MPRFLSRRRLRWIGKKTVKHIVDVSDLAAGSATAINKTIAVGKDSPAQSIPTEVATGARIRRMFFEMNFAYQGANGAASGLIHWYLIHDKNGLINSTGNLPLANNVGGSPYKNLIFQQGMKMVKQGQIVKKIGVVRIPNKLGLLLTDDRIWFVYTTVGTINTFDVCFRCIYKEIRG